MEKKQQFEWDIPKNTNYEYKEKSAESDYIDHREQSLLPHTENEVTEVLNERTIEFRVIGINLFTIKY